MTDDGAGPGSQGRLRLVHILLILCVLESLAFRQDPPEETAADLDKQARDSLQTKAAVLKGLTLPLLFYMLHTSGDVDIQCYVDPIAIPKIDEVTTSATEESPLEEILQKALKGKSLLHQVWQGIVLITDEKGRKAFEDIEWTGLTRKSLGEHAGLAKKLESVFTFKWNAFEPQEALKEFARVSGVEISADGLKGLKIKIEQRGMLSPSHTTLRGALACLARTTGITYEISKDGALVAKPPPKPR
jgi:hypothetical protein